MSENTSFKELVAQVKRTYDISDYITQSGVSLKRAGGGKWKGLCPFHNEKTPSFTVDDALQNYICFGCGAKGDIFEFVQQNENLDFVESLKKLGEDKGIEIEFNNTDSTVDYRALRACVKDAANFFHSEFRKLPKTHEAVKEITDRDLSVKGMLYGYAPAGNALYKYLRGKGYSDEVVLQAGVVNKSEKYGTVFDFWSSRLMFFVTDITGKPIAFSGRKLYDTDTMGKYVNSPDTPLFDKSASLYNISNAKKKAFDEKTLYVTEGQFDVAAFHESNMENSVASLGTAFTERHGLICRRLVTEDGKIVFCFDGDSAGINAVVKVFRQVPSIHNQSYVVIFPDDEDPCDYKLKYGAEGLEEYVKNNQKPMVEFILDVTAKNSDLDTSMGRSHYIEQAAKVLKTISSFSLREVFVKKVSLDSFSSIETVKQAVKDAVPMVDVYKSNTVDKAVVEGFQGRPDMDADVTLDQDELIELIKEDKTYNAAARMVSLAIIKPELMKDFLDAKKSLPVNMQWIVEDAQSVPEGQRIIAEDFTYSKVMNYVMSESFFPFLAIMDTIAVAEQFFFLRDYLDITNGNERKNKLRMKIFKILDSSKGANSDLLERAIQEEERIMSAQL